MIKIVAGLGNPGEKFVGTRHNIGFAVVDRIACELGLVFSEKFSGELASANIKGEKVYFLKPLTFMNLSGVSLGALARFYKIESSDILVIHDEMNLPYGSIKIRRDGSAGGHNGLKSIIENIGEGFPRIKMGIGRKPGESATGHVLGGFSPYEKDSLEKFMKKGAEAALAVVEEGLDKSMNVFNRSDI